MKNISILLFALLVLLSHSQTDIFSKNYKESRKIAESMTIDQLIGQMVQLTFGGITNEEKETTNPEEAVTLALGSLLVEGNEAPTDNGNIAKIPGLL
jgi:hypothetical protein